MLAGEARIPTLFVVLSILLSVVHKVPRIKELQQVAIEAQGNIDEIRQESEGI